MYLSGSDESFTHQTSLPHAMVASSDPGWRERYWISIQDIERQDLVLTCGFGQYPNQDVQEAFVSLAIGGRQRNLRLARALGADRDRLRVGPFSVEVVDPFRELRLVLDENESGLAFDMRWLGRSHPILEQPHYQVSRARVTHDVLRYVQLGRLSGHLVSPEGTRDVRPDTWWGERDHSWGMRPLPGVEGDPPALPPEWRLLLFCPIQLPDSGLHLYLYEDESGRPVHLSAAFADNMDQSGGAPRSPVVSVDHDLDWVPGAAVPTLSSGTIVLTLADGGRLVFKITGLPGRVYLRGGGYEGWNGWLQGRWKGHGTLEHEVWELDDPSTIGRYAKASSDHLIRAECEGQTGYGVAEYLVLPGHQRYGSVRVPYTRTH